MTITIHSDVTRHRPRELTPNGALRHAWYWYLSLLFVPFLFFLAVLLIRNCKESRQASSAVSDASLKGLFPFQSALL